MWNLRQIICLNYKSYRLTHRTPDCSTQLCLATHSTTFEIRRSVTSTIRFGTTFHFRRRQSSFRCSTSCCSSSMAGGPRMSLPGRTSPTRWSRCSRCTTRMRSPLSQRRPLKNDWKYFEKCFLVCTIWLPLFPFFNIE